MIDCLAFSPHPDDAELFCAGLLLKSHKNGKRTAVVDLTRGELGTNGDPVTREREAALSATILGLQERRNLELPDGNLTNTFENRLKIIKVVRDLKPAVCLVPYWIDRHPDHEAASHLIRDGLFFAGLPKIDTEQDPFRPIKTFYYMLHTPFEPSFVVDISNEFNQKMKAIHAYESQFSATGSNTKHTFINQEEFLKSIEIRARFYGYRAGCTYGEPYYASELLKLDNILQFFA